MRNASNAFHIEMEIHRNFYCTAEITFSNGIVKELGRDDFALSGNSVTESPGSSSLPLGLVIPKQITLALNNYDDRWSEYDFQWAKIFLRTKFDLSDGRTEVINIGNFTVITPESYGTIVEILAMDDSYKLDQDYSTNLDYPLSVGRAVRDSCSSCGVSLLTTSFENDDFVIQEKPESLTHRQFIGLCAMMAGGNARFDGNNRLEIIPYDFSRFDKLHIDGGVFDTGNPGIYETGSNIDGGSFSPWNTGGAYDGGQFGDRNDIHILFAFKSGLTIETDDVVITGVKIKSREGNESLYGKEGYVLSVENVLVTGKEEEAASLIGKIMVGLKFRPFSGDHVAYPLAEFGDIALLVDRKQNIYQTVITDVDFSYYGFTSLKCSAESPIRNSSKYYGNEVKTIVEANRLVEKEKTERERALEELARELAQSSGLYMTKEEQTDGSAIYYMHDKPTLAESRIVWKLTAEALGISTDGGKTYPYGLDVTGMAILNRIYAIGINCDYLTTGAFEIKKDGKVMVLMDKDTGQVVIRPDVFELLARYFAVTENGEMYSNDPVAVGYLRMAGTVGDSLSVSAAKRLSANVMHVLFNSSSTEDTGTYTLRIGNVGTQPGGWSISKTVLEGDTEVFGNFKVGPSYTKSKEAKTDNYGVRLLYCYEMPSPMFGDIGEGKTDEDGICCIFLDDIFSETINTKVEYQVFLQKEGPGEVWVKEKQRWYFVVEGTPGLKFAWEVKAKQAGFEYERLETPENLLETQGTGSAYEYLNDMEELILEREAALNETA